MYWRFLVSITFFLTRTILAEYGLSETRLAYLLAIFLLCFNLVFLSLTKCPLITSKISAKACNWCVLAFSFLICFDASSQIFKSDSVNLATVVGAKIIKVAARTDEKERLVPRFANLKRFYGAIFTFFSFNGTPLGKPSWTSTSIWMRGGQTVVTW